MIIFQSKLLRSVSSDAPDVLAPINLESSYDRDTQVMTLTWTSRSLSETGQRIYRNLTPTPVENLGEPYAFLGAGITEYEDVSVTEGQVYYYYVSAVSGGNEAISAELRAKTVLVPPFDISGEVEEVEEGDPHWDKVVSLLHFDGNTIDSSGEILWTAYNTTFVEGGFNEAIEFTPSSSRSRVWSAVSPSFQIGLEDFTVEFCARIDTSRNNALIDWRPTTSSSGITNFLIESDLGNLYLWTSDSYRIGPFSGVINPETLHHIALSREAGLARLFLDGQLLGSGAYPESITNNFVTLGANQRVAASNSANDLAGIIDELRITKGVARYTENFTPPTKPFPNFGP